MTDDLLKRIRVLDPPMSQSRMSATTNTNDDAASPWSVDHLLRKMEEIRQYELAERMVANELFRKHGPRLLALKDGAVECLFHEIWKNRSDPFGSYVPLKPSDRHDVLELAGLIEKVVVDERIGGRVAHSFVYRLTAAGSELGDDLYGNVDQALK